MEKNWKVLTINPGSTSTKVALFENEQMLFSENISHSAEELEQYHSINEQLPFRRDKILNLLNRNSVALEEIDAFSGRGGGLVALPGGTYPINEKLLQHATIGLTVQHPAQLGAQLAFAFSKKTNAPCFVVNPPDVDEFEEVARITGLKEITRESRIHALNQKEVGIRYGKETGKGYENLNLIIAHLGGGISITAHRKGKMIDSTDNISGDGPMTPTRSGALPVKAVVRMCYSGKYSEAEMVGKITKSGGLVNHLGTSDVREVINRIDAGDQYAKRVYDGMVYQITKYIGSMAAVLKGDVDAILLTGGISHVADVVEQITGATSFIAPVRAYPGEFELEALAAGALRVLRGEEEPKEYSGIPSYEQNLGELSEVH